MSTGSTVAFPTSTGTSFGEHCEHCAFGHPWALPGGAVEAQSLSNGGASGPSSVEQYKHKACASGASGSFRVLPDSFGELCGLSGPSPVEHYKHKGFAIVDLLRRLPLPVHLLGRVQLLVAQVRRHLLGRRNGVACG